MADEASLEEKERRLKERLESIAVLESEIKERERSVKQKETARKQIVLRLPPSLWNDIAKWAEEDFRSINGQIEFILSQAVKKRYDKSEK
ncbi:MAG: Arc family DNA-binding protein [Ruminococcus sp.]|nr:Arc family DNA-binding protein [Ruminococcus sp.]